MYETLAQWVPWLIIAVYIIWGLAYQRHLQKTGKAEDA